MARSVATKPTFRLVCRIEQRSLISLLNAAKKTARFLTIAAEILARRVADRGNNSENSG